MEDERDLNIVLVGLDPSFVSAVARQLAQSFDMYFLDSMELYKFDILPLTLGFVLRRYGIDYFREKQTDTIKYVASFSNTVITVESGALLYQENLDIINRDGLIVYLKQNENYLYKKLTNADYFSKEEYNFYCLSKRELIERDFCLSNVAEITSDVTGFSVKDCVNEIILKIEKYYGVK